MAILTDNLLSQLYLGLAKDYNELKHLPADQIYNRLYNNIHASLHSHLNSSALKNLNEVEKQKVWKVLTIFMNASPAFNQLPQHQRDNFFNPKINVIVIEHTVIHQPYCANDNFFTWLMLHDMLHSHNRVQVGSSLPSHNHRHSSSSDDPMQWLFYLLLIALSLAAIIATVLSMYYMLNQFITSMERFVYNEDWLKATFTLASMVGGAAAGSWLGVTLALDPLATFAAMAGLTNPIGFAVFGIVCLTFISAALTCGIVNWAYSEAAKNQDMIDPTAPCRFALTDSEKAYLEEQGKDPLATKCAIIALRQKIEEAPKLSWYDPNRYFADYTGERRKYLETVRQLRSGRSDSIVQIGDMHFQITKPPMPPVYSPGNEHTSLWGSPPSYQASQASAPPGDYYQPGAVF